MRYIQVQKYLDRGSIDGFGDISCKDVHLHLELDGTRLLVFETTNSNICFH